MLRAPRVSLAAVSFLIFASAGWAAAPPGKAVGTFTYDGTTVTLTSAVSTKVEGLFDSAKQDTLVVLSDVALGTTPADDDVEVSLRARKGELVALMLRIDGAKLVNVAVFHKGLSGKTVLPGQWFQYSASKPGAGSLKLAARQVDDHKYACAAEFEAAPAPNAVPPPPEPPAPAAKPAPPAVEPKPAPASTSNIDPKAATALLVQAMMKKDEHQALEIIKLGADPNGRDQYGTPVLNWAVMVCLPQVVKALVDRKADLNYQRAPGMTIMTEAGACPEAAKILKAAGAK